MLLLLILLLQVYLVHGAMEHVVLILMGILSKDSAKSHLFIWVEWRGRFIMSIFNDYSF